MAELLSQFEFDGYKFPVEDSPGKGGSGEWNPEEKLVEHDPLSANVTILTSWGFKSRRRTFTGTCGKTTRDTMRTKWQNGTVGTLTDVENRSVQARIVRAEFQTIQPTTRYSYTIEFMER